MKVKQIMALGLGAALSTTAFAVKTTDSPFTTEKGRISYTIGVDMGKTFKLQGVDVDPKIIAQGLQDGFGGKKTRLSTKQMEKTLMAFQNKLMAKQQQAFKTASKKNADEGKAFLAANQKKPGVVTLPSGLQYRVVTAGNGVKPTQKDVVVVDYQGTLVDGTVFDSSYKTGKPVSFPVNSVIPGWTEALQRMPAGSTWELFVPPKLAYGSRGLGGPIGPNQTLIFKVHLITVKGAGTQGNPSVS